LSAIRDFFSITGARATYEEARRVYALMGAEASISMFEADDGHGYTRPRRHAAYRWLGRWLKGTEDTEAEQEIQPETEETLRATESGQVTASLGGETIFSLNVKRWQRLAPVRQQPTTAAQVSANAAEVQRRAREVTGFAPRRDALRISRYGQIQRQG